MAFIVVTVKQFKIRLQLPGNQRCSFVEQVDDQNVMSFLVSTFLAVGVLTEMLTSMLVLDEHFGESLAGETAKLNCLEAFE